MSVVMRPYFSLTFLVLLPWLVSCGASSEEAPSLIAQAQEQESLLVGEAPVSERATRVPSGKVPVATGYVKRAGLHIDIPYLANRRLDSLSVEVVADQLGAELGRKELPETEDEISFEKADVWLYDGRIYRIRKKLAHHMDIPTALGTSGFPLDLGVPIESSSELRWNFAWKMRRIRLERVPDDERFYKVIDVYAFLPKEFF